MSPGPDPGSLAPGGLAPPEAVLLDWDDTLVDNYAAIHDAMLATLAAMGHPPWPLEETRRRARRSLRESFPELFGARWEAARNVFYHRFTATHLVHLAPKPGAATMLAALSGLGLFLAVVSNKMGGYLRSEAIHLGWDGYFGAVVGAADAAADKPAPAVVALALAPSGLAPGPRVWLVGDGVVDMKCARRAGCTAVLLREHPPGREEFGPHMPDGHVRDCAGLAALIQSLQPRT